MISRSRQDILEKLIADLSRVFATLLGLPTPEALEEIQEYYHTWLGLDSVTLNEFSPEKLLDFLVQEKDFTCEQLELAAELLAKEGEILNRDQQLPLAKDHLQKALVIFGHVEKHSQLFSFQRRQTIDNTIRLLEHIPSNYDL